MIVVVSRRKIIPTRMPSKTLTDPVILLVMSLITHLLALSETANKPLPAI
jgi:hypothetical protein